ncbi:protein-arginine deiminase type-2 [Neolamprologus brichardi]|uniref:protein-arginine deiminase type-2 n=1 Tax=Neolamprologus brichardi TaxID=32507 RepID=UPI001643B12A|nr:protein-arginine deiminase type-2 [Neolamprologus brichardi]
MIHPRTLRIDYGKTTTVLYVVGSELNVNLNRSAPPTSKFFSVKGTANVQYSISPTPRDTSHLSPIPLTENSVLLISRDHASQYENDSKLSVQYYGANKEVLGRAVVHLTAVELSLDVDADRDGIVEKNNPKKGSWKWGPNGHGAILLVNCDSEKTYKKTLDSEDKNIYKVSGKPLSVQLQFSPINTQFFHLFSVPQGFLNFPYDKDFNGLVTINLSLLEPISDGLPETPIFTDKVVFKVAPWIMTPNTLRPVEVFVCSTSDNYQFLKGMRNLVAKSGYKLNICHEYVNRGDRWMQDELEFGYIDSPHHHFPVVLDSPRDGNLANFPYDELLGPDFGYVTRVALDEHVSSLDSFGNLEVSPPVTVNGKKYPLGRIIIGVAFPTATKGRNMTKVVQDFLWAQKVQEPIALFSDWLFVGHVDEFMTFVPAPNRKGFRLLLASPDAGYKLFRGLQNSGHGQATLFDGLTNAEQITLDKILKDEKLQAENNYVQSCIDWNRDVLKRELGLDDEDIIDLPILFKLVEDEKEYRAVAYYPDMVNMIVLGKNLGIPKPFGPKVNGRCALEAEMCSLMEGLGLNCTFIDDYSSYHQLLGEVHCGSNVRREPFEFKWWNLEM